MNDKLVRGICLIVTVFAGSINVNADEYAVTSSTTAAYAAGDKISEESALALGESDQLRILNTQTGETRVLVGPFKGQLSAYQNACSADLGSAVDCAPASRKKPLGATRGKKTKQEIE